MAVVNSVYITCQIICNCYYKLANFSYVILGTYDPIQPFFGPCGHTSALTEVLVDLTLQQCQSTTDPDKHMIFVNYDTHCIRLQYIPRYGLLQRLQTECSFQIAGRKQLKRYIHHTDVTECGYGSRHSELNPGYKWKTLWTNFQTEATLYIFHPACQYLSSVTNLLLLVH